MGVFHILSTNLWEFGSWWDWLVLRADGGIYFRRPIIYFLVLLRGIYF